MKRAQTTDTVGAHLACALAPARFVITRANSLS
ncbi:hypothetical protein M2447_001241 [Ereboglobus sp. PH5-10]|nr:hypothetical protein [Ereboglobus sp. PH5-10]